MQKNTFYRPITATPFRKERSYTELAPCAALRNVVCCFWGSETPYLYDRAVHKPEQLVIPDMCMMRRILESQLKQKPAELNM